MLLRSISLRPLNELPMGPQNLRCWWHQRPGPATVQGGGLSGHQRIPEVPADQAC